ncbi:UDP-N-acetylmuramoyl-L-alanyl-D-glutamate--2,6-diaminopimelate ligase [Candidatus Marinimicrobia bacterium]|nr:UDP-N-acetylmuramoyl-L-alanyl-D-glutamate--2,6-diaminopimelate ligase [Candidatus Neomarinimicrobiota bacterium]
MNLKELVKDIVQDYDSIPKIEINDICTHSEEVTNGSLFVAMYGKNFDGHDFIQKAIEKGASAIISNGRDIGVLPIPNIKVANPRLAASKIAAKYYGNPSKKLKVIGITGTNGKTTTASIVYNILKSGGIKCAQLGTLGVIADGFISEKTLTTPDPIKLHKTFSDFLKKEFSHIIMEVSSHALDQMRVSDIEFDVASFTNLSPEHLDYHLTIEDYFHAKSKLFHGLSITSTSIINFDDKMGKLIAKESKAPVISVSKTGDSDIYFSDLEYNIDGIKGTILAGDKIIEVDSALIGEFNVENILCAVGIANSIGMSEEVISLGIKNSSVIPGRMEVFYKDNGGKIIVDYAHTPDAYEKVLKTISKMKSRESLLNVLFGCGGDRDPLKRPEMGRIVEKYADKLWITPDNPRSELIESINNEIISGLSLQNHMDFDDRGVALSKALNDLGAKDILLVLGKGRENYQEISGKKMEYSDIAIIEKIINAN